MAAVVRPTDGPSLAEIDRASTTLRKQSSSHASVASAGVHLTRVPLTLATTSLYALHIVCAVYCFTAAMLFQALPPTATAYYLDFYAATLPSRHFRAIAIAHNAIGCVHCAILVQSIYQQLCTRLPWLRAWLSSLDSRLRVVSSHYRPHRGLCSIATVLYRGVRQLYRCVFTRTGLLGVEGKYFDALFAARELVDVALQSYQAYHMCLLLPRPTLNRWYVATLVANCWATPLLHVFLMHNVPLQRLLSRLCDLLLDFVSGVGVPVVLALDYWREYDPIAGDLPADLWWDDQWFIRAMNEAPLILFGSWLDALSRLGFCIGLLLSLDDIKLLLHYRRPIATTSKSARATSIVPLVLAGEPQLGCHGSRDATSHTHKASKPLPPSLPARRSVAISVLHWLMAGYGIAVLAVHLHAELRGSAPPGCVLRVRPWLITQPACALVEINCHPSRLPSSTRTDDLDGILTQFDPFSLEQIVVRHCSSVHMPEQIQRFRNLIGVKLYNTTLVSWPEEAALSQRYHPRLRSAFFIRTQFANGSLPDGLLSPEFPSLLRDIVFSVTNLHWITPDLHLRWPPGISLCLEISALTEFPMTFTRAQFYTLTLHWNQITSVPVEAFATLGYLALTGNPISHLPEGVDMDTLFTYVLFMDSTNLTSLPSWIGESYLKTKYLRASRTPLCENVAQHAPDSALMQATPWLTRMDCSDKGEEAVGVYPLALEERENEV